ncbi:glycosyltransferase family 1 protein [Nocardiopsis alba]|uniref:glycosyltransferase family 1 protein n=1 Tax=Nocardiopsis alba TaxID=53437 RepID=UPI00366B1B61
MGVSAIPHKYVAVVAVGIAALAIAFSPPRIGLVVAFIALSGVVLAVGALLERSRRESTAPLHDLGEAVEQVAATQHEERLAARHRATTLDERLQEYRQAIERPVPPVPPPPGTVRLRRAQDLLWCGFSSEGLERLRSLGSDMDVTESVRSESHRSLANWYTAAGEGARAREHAHLADLAAPRISREATGVPRRVAMGRDRTRRDRHFDVVVLSDFRLPGGSTGSNLQEITAQRRAGLRTGLVHHPVRSRGLSGGVNPKVLAAVDGDLVRFVAPDERITCDLLVVRVPRIGERIMDEMPQIEAERSIVVLNQTPNRCYGVPDFRGNEAWNVARCAAGFGEMLGEHRWYPISSRVREAMEVEHAAEMAEAASWGITLADEDWTNIIDAPAWRRGTRRSPDGRVLLGRHSRDDKDKWPDDPRTLQSAYPEEPGWQTRVLGGASVPERMLGDLPSNWQVHPFDSVPVREFLHGLDVYVYFTRKGHLEPFGRSPLEAIAAGVPTLLPESFRPVFGDAAIYTDPAGVRAEVDALMADEARYARQVARGHEVVERMFGHDAHLRRLAEMGVRTPETSVRPSPVVPVS